MNKQLYMNARLYLLFLSVLLFACKESRREPKNPLLTPQYYFYPKANVYFDSANKDYIFLANDGRTWQSARQIPAAMQTFMDKSVLIEHPSQPVWKDNEQHKLVYAALLYTQPSDTIEKKEPVIVEKNVPPPPDPQKKERKGIRKFFDKLFGGLKKNKKDSSE